MVLSLNGSVSSLLDCSVPMTCLLRGREFNIADDAKESGWQGSLPFLSRATFAGRTGFAFSLPGRTVCSVTVSNAIAAKRFFRVIDAPERFREARLAGRAAVR